MVAADEKSFGFHQRVSQKVRDGKGRQGAVAIAFVMMCGIGMK